MSTRADKKSKRVARTTAERERHCGGHASALVEHQPNRAGLEVIGKAAALPWERRRALAMDNRRRPRVRRSAGAKRKHMQQRAP
jgi:hypothetical protein